MRQQRLMILLRLTRLLEPMSFSLSTPPLIKLFTLIFLSFTQNHKSKKFLELDLVEGETHPPTEAGHSETPVGVLTGPSKAGFDKNNRRNPLRTHRYNSL